MAQNEWPINKQNYNIQQRSLNEHTHTHTHCKWLSFISTALNKQDCVLLNFDIIVSREFFFSINFTTFETLTNNTIEHFFID